MLDKFKYNIKHPVKHLKAFIKDEDGAEMIEIAIGIAIAAVLIAAVTKIAGKAQTGMENANDKIDDVFKLSELKDSSTTN